MELLGLILIALWTRHYVGESRAAVRAAKAQAKAYRHPALQPATIYTPEFYASLAAEHDRPFLGK